MLINFIIFFKLNLHVLLGCMRYFFISWRIIIMLMLGVNLFSFQADIFIVSNVSNVFIVSNVCNVFIVSNVSNVFIISIVFILFFYSFISISISISISILIVIAYFIIFSISLITEIYSSFPIFYLFSQLSANLT